MCDAVRAGGAEPAVTAVVRGAITTGLAGDDLERFLDQGARKVSARDLPFAIASGGDGATTVAATLAICVREKLDVFATGGIGGVHRDPRLGLAPTYDESADLLELSRSSVITVCAGAKSILDLPATVERLETYGVSVIGFGTDEFPGFFTRTTGLPVPASTDRPEVVARTLLAARKIGRPGGILVVQPPPAEHALDPGLIEGAIAGAIADLRAATVTGGAVTPFLLAAVDRATEGRSVRTNLALLESNAALAARIALALGDEAG